VILNGQAAAHILDPVNFLFIAAVFTTAAFAASPVSASPVSTTPAIGIVTASGHFTLQGSEVWGNATLFEGSTVETTAASSQLALSNGVKMQLGAGSRARVFAGRLMLDKGVGQVGQAAPFEVDAAGFKIRGAGVRVGVGAPGQTVEIAALTGVAKVFGNGDVLLAAVPAGRHMNLAFQAAQTGTPTRTGCLVYKDAHYILQDDDTQEVVELAGNAQDFSKNLGNRVEVKGTASTARPAVTVATSVLSVSAISPKSQGGCLVVAAALNAQTEVPSAVAPAPATAANTPAASSAGGGGLSGGAKAAIIIAIAGGAGGAAAAVLLTQNKKSTSP
jgi:hypothetical protein